MHLTAGIAGEGIVSERVEFRQNLGPGEFFQTGQDSQRVFPPGQRCYRCDADRRRNQQQACRHRRRDSFQRIKGEIQRQRRAGRIADDVNQRLLPQLSRQVFHP